jgi:hypothetical protein
MRSVLRARRAWIAFGIVLCARAVAASPLTPEETVRRYLQAVKEAKFDAAYELISHAMKQGKDRATWVKEQADGMAWADVKVFSFEVGSAKVDGQKAYVPDVLSSQDKFVNQLGLTEYELYTLVKEDGAWKVDEQVIVEPADIPKWFPQARKGAAAPAPGGGSPTSH